MRMFLIDCPMSKYSSICFPAGLTQTVLNEHEMVWAEVLTPDIILVL